MLKWLLVFLAGALVGANAVFFLMTRETPELQAPEPELASQAEVPAQPASTGTDTTARTPSAPSGTSSAPPTDAKPSQRTQAVPATAGGLIVPVQGVTAAELTDSFEDARGARVHHALDIMAPHGTPVLAVADGHVEKLFDSKQGGLTLYQFEPSGRYVYYYAHLDSYASGVVGGKRLRQGEVIGYVGSTGNADVAAPHLHFEVSVLGPERQWWKASPVNPYPLLGGK